MVGAVLAGQGDHLGRGGVHGGHLGVDRLLVRVPLRLLPLDAGGVRAERRQLGLLRQDPARVLDGLLTRGDGGDQGSLGLGHDLELFRVLGLDTTNITHLSTEIYKLVFMDFVLWYCSVCKCWRKKLADMQNVYHVK